MLLSGDLSDVLDGPPYIVGDRNPRRPATAAHVLPCVTHAHKHTVEEEEEEGDSVLCLCLYKGERK